VGPNKGALFAKYYPLTKKYTLLEPNRHFEKDYIKLQKRHPNLYYEINNFEAFSANETFDTIVIESYPDDKYTASCLLLGFTIAERPLHLQVSLAESDVVKIITVYEPDEKEWIDYYQRR
jgi:hypothetical protein